jgi:hypothetical protein
MPNSALRTEKVGLPTRLGRPGAVRLNSNNEAEKGASVQEFWSARVGTPTPEGVD